MGGSIKFIARFQDGSVEHTNVWTNSLAYDIRSKHLVEKDEKFFKEMIDEFKKDKWYGKNNKIGVAPDGYGITLIDFQNNKVYVMSGYSHYVSEVVYFQKNALEEFEYFVASGRAYYLNIEWNDDENINVLIPGVKFSYDILNNKNFTLVDSSAKVDEDFFEKIDKISSSFYFDLSPFEFVYYEETKEGVLKLKADLLKAGFEVDAKQFSEYLEERYEEEDNV